MIILMPVWTFKPLESQEAAAVSCRMGLRWVAPIAGVYRGAKT